MLYPPGGDNLGGDYQPRYQVQIQDILKLLYINIDEGAFAFIAADAVYQNIDGAELVSRCLERIAHGFLAPGIGEDGSDGVFCFWNSLQNSTGYVFHAFGAAVQRATLAPALR